MSNDVRERLHEAVGDAIDGPDIEAVIRRGNRLRRRRQLGFGGAALAVAAIATVFGATLDSTIPLIEGPTISDDVAGHPPEPADPLGEQLALFDEPPPEEERRPPSFSIGGANPLPGVQYPAQRLQEPRPLLEQAGTDNADLRRARLAATHDDLAIDLDRPLEVYLVPHTGKAVDPDGTPLAGDWIHVYLTGPGHRFWGSAPIPQPGEAAWAGSVPVGGQLTGLIVAGDGLDTAHSDQGAVQIEDNVVVLNGFGYDSSVSLSGPAGQFTLTTPSQ